MDFSGVGCPTNSNLPLHVQLHRDSPAATAAAYTLITSPRYTSLITDCKMPALINSTPKPSKKATNKKPPTTPEKERFMQACADIARQLIQDHEENNGSKITNLNKLRGQVSKKYQLKSIPPLTAILAAIPEHYKKYIQYKLLQKPVRESRRF